VQIHQSFRRNTNEIQWKVKKSDWKNTEVWKNEGKGDKYQNEQKPRIPESILIASKHT